MDIVDKVKKLLALSTSSNPHEAAAAAARAQELMFEHKLAMADLEIAGARPAEEPVTEDGIFRAKCRVPWKGALANALARSMGCRMYWHGPTIQIVGRKSDMETVRYTFGYLVLEIERLAAIAWSQVPESERVSYGKSVAYVWKNSFRLGAVETLSARLKEQKATQEAKAQNSTALMIVRRGEVAVDAYVASLRLGHARFGGRRSSDGMSAGRAAGASISLGGSRAAIGGSKQRIGA